MPPMAAAIGSAARRGVAQVARDELALELQADDEEEDRQQPVGRPRRDAQMQMQRLRADREFRHRAVASATTASSPTPARRRGRGSSSMPPTVSLRRISVNRCVSDHEPRVSRRVGICRSLVNERDYVLCSCARDSAGVAEWHIRLPAAALYGIFTPGAPGSLVGSRTAGDDSDNGRGSSEVAVQTEIRWGWQAPRYRMDLLRMP